MRAGLLVLLGVCLSLSVGCENPLEIDRETEIEIGCQGGADLEKQYGVVKDAAMQKRLDAIGARVAAVSEEPDLPWTFRILDSEEVNAVALPGGPVYVMRGMMEYAKSDDQLAGVLAHEVVHADHHHAKGAIEKAMTEQLLAELVFQKSSDSIRQAAGIALDLDMRQGYREKEYEVRVRDKVRLPGRVSGDRLAGLAELSTEEGGRPGADHVAAPEPSAAVEADRAAGRVYPDADGEAGGSALGGAIDCDRDREPRMRRRRGTCSTAPQLRPDESGLDFTLIVRCQCLRGRRWRRPCRLPSGGWRGRPGRRGPSVAGHWRRT